MKNFTPRFTSTRLIPLWLAVSLLASMPSRADEQIAAPPPASQAQTPDSAATVHVAWDRVGSPERSFG